MADEWRMALLERLGKAELEGAPTCRVTAFGLALPAGQARPS